ncbi:MAG TPA: SurA N-terminal domain-containing protein [Acidobacteriota bacterium]|nr:SurA N-terminal domain-containing protein [Acidobacteriota bacterium]
MIFFLLPQQQVADRVVAIVNEEPIMLSELRQTLPERGAAREDLPQLMRTNLEALINQALILEEIQRLKIFVVSEEEVDSALAALGESFGSVSEMELELRSRGTTLEGLREALRKRLLVLKFVDYRFRRYNELAEDEIREFYEGEWSAQFRTEYPQRPLPPFEEVRQQLEQLLIERDVNSRLDAWLQKARAEARIIITI